MKRMKRWIAGLGALIGVLSLHTPVLAGVPVPMTGDERPFTIIIVVMVVALAAIVGFAVVSAKGSGKKKKK